MRWWIGIVVVGLFILSSCSPPDQEDINAKNPATEFCEAQGHTIEARIAVDGRSYRACVFPDGSECDEWSYLLKECRPGQVDSSIPAIVDLSDLRFFDNFTVYHELSPGESKEVEFQLVNTLGRAVDFELVAEGKLKPFVFFEKNRVEVSQGDIQNYSITFVVPKNHTTGTYDGFLNLQALTQKKVPATLQILRRSERILDIEIQPLDDILVPGDELHVQTDLLLSLEEVEPLDVTLFVQFLKVSTGEVIATHQENITFNTLISAVKTLDVPRDVEIGEYIVQGSAYYMSDGEQLQATSVYYVNVKFPFLRRKVLGLSLWIYLTALVFSGLVFLTYYFYKRYQFSKKRFKVVTDLKKLPKPGKESVFVGKIAEVGAKAYMDMNKLRMHTLVAGSTGSGKTVAAQGIIEAVLTKEKTVIVFDPTAQWSGFLRKCTDPSMLRRYQYFDMKSKEARSFNGIVKTITDPYEFVDIKKYMDIPGQITVFDCSGLTPKEMDIVVASTIQQIFRSAPEEATQLNNMIVYDEVHRLLKKFGGSGEGFVQVERGCREFRKWGIGLLLISQVLNDFVGEIKANIGTEIQMGTRFEGDLQRVGDKYGDVVLKSVVKEPIGTGMMVNAEFNDGRPYFVAFRPLLHDTRRMSKETLMDYKKHFEEIEDIEYQLAELKKLGVDILDLQMELKLSKSKVQQAQFQMVDMYMETLKPRVEQQWKNLGKEPVHLVKKRISKDEVKKAVEDAKKARQKIDSSELKEEEGGDDAGGTSGADRSQMSNDELNALEEKEAKEAAEKAKEKK